MKEYIITVKNQFIFGGSILENHFCISGDTMKEAKEYAKTLVSGNIVSVTAHKVKDGEEVPEIYYSWLYR